VTENTLNDYRIL